MISSLKIPAFKKIIDEHDKSFTVFQIDVYLFSGQMVTLQKRYSQLDELHKKLHHVIDTPSFPPKTVLKWNHRVLENRRQGLEAYLQGIVHQGKLPSILLNFLDLHSPSPVVECERASGRPRHQAVMAFSENCFLREHSSSKDIVSQGVIQGLYGSTDELT